MHKIELEKKDDSLPDTIDIKKDFNKGLGRILFLIVIAFLAILTLNLLKTGSNNNLDNEAKKKDLIDEQKLIEEKEILVEDFTAVNKLGSTVNEKIDLGSYKNINENIKSVYRIYDMSENQNGYLVQVISKGEKGNILLSVIFDNIGKKIISVKLLNGLEGIKKNNMENVNTFFDQFNRVNAPIILEGDETVTNDSKTEIPSTFSELALKQTSSVVNGIKGSKESSKAIINGINTAYQFIQNVIMIDSKKDEDSKRL